MEMNRITGRNEVQAGVAGSDGKAKQEDGYSWTQTEEELELSVDLPSVDDVQSKDIRVKFHPQNVDVSFRNKELLSIRLFERVDVDGCTWTLDRNSANESSALILTLEKLEQAYWPRIKD